MTLVEHLTDLERRLLTSLLAGDHPALAVLREQLAGATVTERELSGVGFFTHFHVSPAAPRLPVRHWVMADVDFHLDGLEHPAGALLSVEDGVLSMLEAYTYASEDWPEEPESHYLYYTTRGRAVGSGFQIVRADIRDLTWLAEEYDSAQNHPAAS